MSRLVLLAVFAVAGCDSSSPPPDRIRASVIGSISSARNRVVVECTEAFEALSYVYSVDGAMTLTCSREWDAGGSR